MRRGLTLAGLLGVLAGCSGQDGSNRQAGNGVAADATALANEVGATSAVLIDPPPDPACAAQTGVAATICADPVLARMDKEVARLFALVRGGQEVTPDMVPSLDQEQRTWTVERDRCGVGEPARTCLLTSYISRIDELRSNYADARAAPATSDARPVSNGPFSVRCKGLEQPIHALFINVDPDMVRLRWDQELVILAQVPAASGVRYERHDAGGSYVFWTKGQTASFSSPGRRDLSCTMEPEHPTPAS